jgi:hypothetical protein
MNRNGSRGLGAAPARDRGTQGAPRWVQKSLISLTISETLGGVYQVLILLGKDCGHNRPKQLLRVPATAKADTPSNSLQHSNFRCNED